MITWTEKKENPEIIKMAKKKYIVHKKHTLKTQKALKWKNGEGYNIQRLIIKNLPLRYFVTKQNFKTEYHQYR